ncbi:hypothetical protein ABZX65_27830 [Streptomyces sp. NPDC003300]|uniref:hypothetical protein n=1 Tax=unclassified Streptomyces TaxID=2593676 RepID=UPI0033A57A27
MTARQNWSLPASVNCVLARRDPAGLAVELAAARRDMTEFTLALDDSRTYLSPKRANVVRHQGKALARSLRRISARLCRGGCARLRAHPRLGRYVSVHERDVLDDGGVLAVRRGVLELTRALATLRSREPFYVRVRDREMSSTRSRMSAYGASLGTLLDTVVLDLTAADLSGLNAHAVSGLRALWSPSTVWSPAAAKKARATSREIGPGVFLL